MPRQPGIGAATPPLGPARRGRLLRYSTPTNPLPLKNFLLFPKNYLYPLTIVALNCNSYQPGVNDEHDIPDQSKGVVPAESAFAEAVDQEHSAFGGTLAGGPAAAAGKAA
jgi:hypothetical protein